MPWFLRTSMMALVATFMLPANTQDRAGTESRVSLSEPSRATDASPIDAATRLKPPQWQAALGVTQSRAKSSVQEAPLPNGSSFARLLVGRGDKVRIGFYETVELEPEGQGGPELKKAQTALRTFYQRTDLSGEYTVDQNGAVSVPLLGEFEAAGRAVEEIGAEMAKSFQAVTGRTAKVDVSVLDRSPVYVTGLVKLPGAYKYAPGMFVLQAVSLAGGIDRSMDSLSARVESARETERLRLAILQIRQLLARRARLDAQRDGGARLYALDAEASTISTPSEGSAPTSMPNSPRASEPPTGAEVFSAAEGAILEVERAKRRQQEKDLNSRLERARSEVEAMKNKLEQFSVQKNLRIERLDNMQKLKDRGIETNDHVLTLRTELADIEARREDSRVTLIEAEARLAQAEQDGYKDSLEYSAALSKEIATVDKDIESAQETASSAEALAAMINTHAMPDPVAHYEIVRQTKDGGLTLEVSETSQLLPGDVLKVK